MPIRAATEADIDAVRRVAEESWETDYPGILTRETATEGVADWYAHERLLEELDRPRTSVLVAERGDSLVGFAHATRNEDDEGYVLRLYVRPGHRRSGVGAALLERTCEELVDQGVDRINAMVLAENDPGNEFYRSFGFEYADERETTVGGESYPENRYVLEREAALERGWPLVGGT